VGRASATTSNRECITTRSGGGISYRKCRAGLCAGAQSRFRQDKDGTGVAAVSPPLRRPWEGSLGGWTSLMQAACQVFRRRAGPEWWLLVPRMQPCSAGVHSVRRRGLSKPTCTLLADMASRIAHSRGIAVTLRTNYHLGAHRGSYCVHCHESVRVATCGPFAVPPSRRSPVPAESRYPDHLLLLSI
jgi:hypothetical protein